MTKLTRAQRRTLRRCAGQDVNVWLDMATEIQRAMFWKLERRGYLYIQRDWCMGPNYGVVDTFDFVELTCKGRNALAVQP